MEVQAAPAQEDLAVVAQAVQAVQVVQEDLAVQDQVG